VRSLPQGYRPREFEPQILEYWRGGDVYGRLRRSLAGRPKFYFLDGPPYTSSDTPHIGTLWNKILKDCIVRFKRARGYDVSDRPGYDCHGLPIEVKVEELLGIRNKKEIERLGVDAFVRRCAEFALSNMESMTRHFEEFGVSLDWGNPYLTLRPEYIESAWWLVKRAEEQGLLERDLKVVHWCPRCETTLADYEVSEYRLVEDPSIYVKLPVRGRRGEYIVVWTTTPWTLPANVAVMANPDLEYAWVEAGGERLLMALERVDEVMREAGVAGYRVVEVVRGEELEGLEYVHPLLEEVEVQRRLGGVHRVVLSREYVSAEEGTGLVHCAPGHGEEDFEVGRAYGLPVVSPVDESGVFTGEAGKYAGLPVREANRAIVEDLRAKGLLLHAGAVVHRYPVCWRCKTPLILRAAEQWLVKIRGMKDRFLEGALRVNWIPDWAGYSRFKNWLEGLRDWVLSRQRYWGTPLPIWVCGGCGARVVVGSREELEKLHGGRLELEDLHRPWIDSVELRCGRCGGVMRRVPDVMDVWLDSGVSFYASLGYPGRRDLLERMWPVDFITEGHDQIAGWFFSLLRCGLIAFGDVPYRTVLMHGFALDEQGREMHKSLGNYVAPQEVLEYEKGGRDVLRWYVLRNTVWEDLRFSWRSMGEVYDDLNIMWNVYVFASTYMQLDGFNPAEHSIDSLAGSMRAEDRWLLSRVERLARDVTAHLEGYEVHKAARLLRDFIVEDVSRWYVRLVRPRVWVEGESRDKLAAYAALHHALRKFLVLASPIVPFITEKIFLDSFRLPGDPDSVHMLPWPEAREDLIDDDLERDMEVARRVVERAAAARMRAGVKVRQPLPRLYVLTGDPGFAASVERMRGVIMAQANVKDLQVLPPGEEARFKRLRARPDYRRLGPQFKGRAPLIASLIEGGGEGLARELAERGEAVLTVEGEEVRVTRDMVVIEEEAVEGYVSEELPSGKVVLDVRVRPEEAAEGLARDILRRIQFMRKLMNLPVEAYIEVEVKAPEGVVEAVRPLAEYVARESRAVSLRLLTEGEVAGEFVREWELGEDRVVIGVRRAG